MVFDTVLMSIHQVWGMYSSLARRHSFFKFVSHFSAQFGEEKIQTNVWKI